MATEISDRQAATANQYLVVYEPAPGATPNTLISAGVRRTQLRLRVSPDGRPQPITLGASTESLLTDAAEGGREEFWNAAEQAFASGDINVAAELYEKAHQADTQWGKPLFKLGLVSLNKGTSRRPCSISSRLSRSTRARPKRTRRKQSSHS